jgi:hypothetical protein
LIKVQATAAEAEADKHDEPPACSGIDFKDGGYISSAATHPKI